MDSTQYFVAKTDRYTLFRKIGDRNFAIVSDANAASINSIYQKICNKRYTSEKELYEDIFKQYSQKSIIPLFQS